MEKRVYIPILGIMAGEAIMFYGQISMGLLVELINLLLMTLIVIFSNLNMKEKNVLQSSMLLIILRTINVSMPKFFPPLYQFALIYGIMFIPIFLTIKNQNMSLKDLGINFSRLYFYIPLGVFIGATIAIIEFQILDPKPIIKNISISNLIYLGIIMFIFIGIVEEMIFRSILQSRFEQIIGVRNSILLCGSIFGIMHASYGILYEVLFVIIIGIIMGYIFHKTQNLQFLVSIHGVTNVILFGILPIMRF